MDGNVNREVSLEDSEVDLNFDLDLVDLNEEPQCLPSPLPPSKRVLMQDYEDNDSVFSVPSSQTDMDFSNPRKSAELDSHCHTHSTISQDSGIMSSDSWLVSDTSSSLDGSRPHTGAALPTSECFQASLREDLPAAESKDIPHHPFDLSELGIPQPMISLGEPTKHEVSGSEESAPRHLPLIPVASLTGVEFELEDESVGDESKSPLYSDVRSPLVDTPMDIDDSQEQSGSESDSSDDSDPGAFMRDLREKDVNVNESGPTEGFTRGLDSIDFTLDTSKDLETFDDIDGSQMATPYEAIISPAVTAPLSPPNNLTASTTSDTLDTSDLTHDTIAAINVGFAGLTSQGLLKDTSHQVPLPDAETGESDDGFDNNIPLGVTSNVQNDWWKGDENDNIQNDDEDNSSNGNEIITTDDLDGLDINFSIDNGASGDQPPSDQVNIEPGDQQSETNTTSILSSEATSPEDIPDERRPSLDPFIALSCLDEAIRTAEGDIGSLSSPEADFVYGPATQGGASAAQNKQESDPNDEVGLTGPTRPIVSIIVTSPDEECGQPRLPLIPYDIQPIPQENITQGEFNVSSLADSDEDSDDDFDFVVPTSIPRIAKSDTPSEETNKKKDDLPVLPDMGFNISMTTSDSDSSDDDFDFDLPQTAESPTSPQAASSVAPAVQASAPAPTPAPAPAPAAVEVSTKPTPDVLTSPAESLISASDDGPAVLDVNGEEDCEDRVALECAEDEWDAVRTITPGFQDENETRAVKSELRAHPMISVTEVVEHCQAANLSAYKDQIRPTVQRQGFSALKHALFGPPKMHRDLLDQRNNIFLLAAWPLDNENVTHMRTLQTIYRRLTGSKFDCTRFGPHWEVIGFQGNDPATDLRGTGFLGLVQLLYLLTDPSLYGLAKDIYRLSLHETQNFPFCVMSINITRIVLQTLREDVLNKECNKRKDVLSMINEFYAALYYHLYITWKTGHKTIKDSGFVIRDLEAYARKNCRNVVKNLSVQLISRREANNSKQTELLNNRESLHLQCVNINDFDAED